MKLDDIDRMTKTKLMSYLATSCKLTDSGLSYTGLQSRVGKPVTCSVAPLSPCQSPTQIIPSPTASSPIETHSPSAFSAPVSLLPRSPTEKGSIFSKPLAVQRSNHATHKPFVSVPKVTLSQKDFESRGRANVSIEQRLWRPWWR